MNYHRRREREGEWRWLVAVLSIWMALTLVLIGCARSNSYSDDPVPSVDQDTLVKITISNDRGRELGTPRFYLMGLGRQSLGVTEAFDQSTVYVSRRWIPLDGCMRVLVHYAGAPDYYSAPFCWHPGEQVDVRLNQGGELLVAWSHP